MDDGLPVVVDPRLVAAGAPHRDAVLRAAPATWNGSILGFRALEGDTVVAGRTDYFTMLATSDALRAELVARGDGGPMRTRRGSWRAAIRGAAARAAPRWWGSRSWWC